MRVRLCARAHVGTSERMPHLLTAAPIILSLNFLVAVPFESKTSDGVDTAYTSAVQYL
jgi:hypothetical protein